MQVPVLWGGALGGCLLVGLRLAWRVAPWEAAFCLGGALSDRLSVDQCLGWRPCGMFGALGGCFVLCFGAIGDCPWCGWSRGGWALWCLADFIHCAFPCLVFLCPCTGVRLVICLVPPPSCHQMCFLSCNISRIPFISVSPTSCRASSCLLARRSPSSQLATLLLTR